jgi:hypothetical protein
MSEIKAGDRVFTVSLTDQEVSYTGIVESVDGEDAVVSILGVSTPYKIKHLLKAERNPPDLGITVSDSVRLVEKVG